MATGGTWRFATGCCDLAAFGRPTIANSDLVERFCRDTPLNKWDAKTFHGVDEYGCIASSRD